MASDRRLHPLSFVFAIREDARQILVPLAGGLLVSGGRWSWESLLAFALVLTAARAVVKSLTVRYRLDEGELVVRSGVLVKRVTHIPYERIHNINAVQTVLHRMLNVIEVRIETGGGNESEATLSVVDEGALAELRAIVFSRRPAPAAVPAGEAPRGAVLLRLGPRELIILGLVRGRGMLIAGAIYTFLWDLGLMRRVQTALFGDSDASQLVRTVGIPQLLALAGGLIAVLVVFRLVSGLWTALKFYGFALTLDKGDLRMEYGLLTRVRSGVPLRRIQQVTVSEGPWHRLAGYASIDVQTAASVSDVGAQAQRVAVAPLIRAADVPAFLLQILPTVSAPAWQRVDPRGARREFVRALPLVVPIGAALFWGVGTWGLLALIPLVVLAWIRARRYVASLRWSTAGDLIQFESGWVWRRMSLAPISKVQAVSETETPFDRRHRMRALEIDVAGGVTTHTMRMPYLPARSAAAAASDVASRSEAIFFPRAPLDHDPGTAPSARMSN